MEVTLLTTNTEYNIKDKIRISKQDLTKLNSINPSFNITDLLKKETDYYDISTFNFKNFLEDIIFKTDLIYNYSGNLKSNSLKLNQNFEKIRNKYLKIRGSIPYNSLEATANRNKLINKIIDRNIDTLNPFLNLLVEFNENHKKINKLNDLIKAKDNILKNLERICPNQLVKNISTNYEQAIKECNLEKLEQLLLESQTLIINYWKKFITPVDNFDKEKPFYFLCHSICNANFSGEFNSNFVSSSLITKDLTDTFNQGFGFILSPNHIVLACSQDMFVNNNALDTDSLSNSSTIPEINIPEIIIEQALKQKKEYQLKNEKRKIYTEIVSDKFQPLAIFCMTDGSKTLNSNYQNALKLKKNYPNLKIVEIDKTLYKKDLSQEKEKLIFNIEYHISGNILNDKIDYDRYDYFFNKYLELKKTNNYTENDIIDLYKQNKEMLSIFLDFDNIFKNYDIETIKFILLNNYKTNLKNIFDGTFRSFILKNIYDTLKNNDINKLNEVFPGLGNFIKIFPKVTITDEMVTKIKSDKNINFNSINQILLQNLKSQKEENQNQLISYQKQIIKLEKEKLEIEDNIKKTHQCQKFIDSFHLYHLALQDIQDEEEFIQTCKNSKIILETSLNKSKNELNLKKEENKKLQKFKIFNLAKIKIINQEITKLNNKIDNLKKEIEIKNQNIVTSENNIITINNQFEKEIGCHLENYQDLFYQANKFLNNNFAFIYQIDLDTLNQRIDSLNNKIKKTNKEIENIEIIVGQTKK